MEWPRELREARYLLLRKRPYLASVLMNMSAYPVESLPSVMAVDSRWNLYYSPSRLSGLDVQRISAALYHEVWHLLSQHHSRLAAYPQRVANAGGDLAINSALQQEGFTLPEGGLLPDRFGLPDGKSAEWYCDHLPEGVQFVLWTEVAGDGSSGEGDSDRSSGFSDSDDPSGDQSGSTGSSRSAQSDSASGEAANAGTRVVLDDHGSAADGRRRAYEVDSGLPEAMQRAILKETAESILREKQRGTVPAHLERWAEEVLESRIHWRALLRSALRGELESTLARVDYSWRGRNRRQYSTDVVLPVLRCPVPRVAVLVDTSGSMGEYELGMALAEIRAVLRLVPSVQVYSADADIHTARKVFSHRQVKLIGGGGTSMRTAVHRITQRRRDRPHLLVIVTDGETDWPDPVAGTRIVAALTSPKATVPDHIRRIDISGVREDK